MAILRVLLQLIYKTKKLYWNIKARQLGWFQIVNTIVKAGKFSAFIVGKMEQKSCR